MTPVKIGLDAKVWIQSIHPLCRFLWYPPAMSDSGEHEAYERATLNGEEDRMPDTVRPSESTGDHRLVEQKVLTASLLDAPDPTTRLVAHVSQRQLDMFEMLVEMRDQLAELKARLNQS